MADCASRCSAEKRRLRPASSDRIHHAPRMHCMLTSNGQPHHSVSPSNRCSTAPTAHNAEVVCNESAKLRYALWCWPSSLSVPAFPLSTAHPSFGRGRGNLAASMSRDSPTVRDGSSQLSSLVFLFRIRAVDLVCHLCFSHPLLHQWT